ncbi:MAG: hypothetical protein ACRBBR_05370 [Cellvibrionaceae bacterium]
MNNKIMKSAIIGLLSATVLSACGGGGTNFDDPVKDESFSSGDVDLSRYVALGDSLTAGFKDGTLYIDGQLDSFPNILSGLFEEADGGAFTQPLMADNLGGLLFMGVENSEFPARRVLSNVGGELTPIIQPGTPTTETFNVITGPFSNMGVPGAKSFHLLAPNYGDPAGLAVSPATANPFFVRFASAAANTIVADAVTQAPTFFTLWIGNNDILGYGTSGGDGTNPITDTATFDGAYGGIVTSLTAGGAKGVLINLPSIVDIPFFTTVPFNAIPLDQANADAANAAYAAYNGGVAALLAGDPDEAAQRTITFVAGQNAIVIEDESLTDLSGSGLPSVRQATADDYILLTTSSLLGTLRTAGDATTVIGVGSALTDSEALTATEAAEIEVARTAYNTTIEGLAAGSADLALYDAAATLADLNDGDGISYGTGSIDSTFATGGAFSLDGVHPTARGYAVIANGVIDTMNASFDGTDLPRTDPGMFTEVFFEFPTGFDFSP